MNYSKKSPLFFTFFYFLGAKKLRMCCFNNEIIIHFLCIIIHYSTVREGFL